MSPNVSPLVRFWNGVLRTVSPGYSSCKHCGQPWSVAKKHVTQYDRTHGCFPLCEPCWSSMTVTERLPYYYRLWLEWGDNSFDGKRQWEDIKRAVERGM